MEKKLKAMTVRFEVAEGLLADIERLRLAVPAKDRLNRSAFIRKVLIEYVEQHGRKKG